MYALKEENKNNLIKDYYNRNQISVQKDYVIKGWEI